MHQKDSPKTSLPKKNLGVMSVLQCLKKVFGGLIEKKQPEF